MIELSYSFSLPTAARFVAPIGLGTPHAAPLGCDVSGAAIQLVGAPERAQMLLTGTSTGDPITLRVRFAPGGPSYPEAMFAPNDSRFVRSAPSLAEEARSIAAANGGGRAGMLAIISHVAALFDYGHPEQRFYDDSDEMPQLCSMETGSCVDINAYLVSCLRAAGYEAGYIYGVFVPEIKRDWAEDGHCWVVTRHDGICEEWDIAHFLKMGRRDVQPGLNPRPGVRLPMAHSMGWSVPELSLQDLKVIGIPFRVEEGKLFEVDGLKIGLSGYDALAASGARAAAE